MKKLVCVFLLFVFAGITFGQTENKSEQDIVELNKALQQENEELKKLIYDEAVIVVNGESVNTNGLLSGFALAHAKYKYTKSKLYERGNYVEITGEDLLKYKYENLGNETLSVKIKEKENIETSPKEFSKNSTLFGLGLLITIAILLSVFLHIKLSDLDDTDWLRNTLSNFEKKMIKIGEMQIDFESDVKELCNKQLKLSEDIRKGINSIKLLTVQNNTSFIYSNIDGTNKYLLPETKYMLLANNLNTLNDLKKVSENELKALGFKPKIIKNLKNYLAEIGLKLSGNDKEQDSPNDEENRQMTVER